MTVNDLGSAPSLSAQVAEEIRALLARRRISGRELARRMGASHSWVNFRLTGAQPISLDDLEQFAKVLDIEVLDLLPGVLVGAAGTRREGRLITAGGSTRSDDVPVKSHKPHGPEWSPLTSYPHTTAVGLSTRRPGRILQGASA